MENISEPINQENVFFLNCQKKPHLDGTYFDPIIEKSVLDGSKIVAKCVNCPNENALVSGTFNSTSNFQTHLKRKHPNLTLAFRAYCTQKRSKMENKQPQPISLVSNQEVFERNVTSYILDSMAPLRTVEMPSFRKMFEDLLTQGGKIKHVSRNTVTRNINTLYSHDMNSINAMIENVSYVCTTADIWSCSTRSFLGVTAHWINSQTLERHSAAIACRRFKGIHSYERIAFLLEEIHSTFGLSSGKLIATITDNATNFVKAFKEFGPPEEEIVSSDEDMNDIEDSDIINDMIPDEIKVYLPQHFRCACHTLNLVATTDFEKILKRNSNLSTRHNITLKRASILWNKQRSSKQSEIIKDILGRSLHRPTPTRWNTLFQSFKVVLNSRDNFNRELYILLGIPLNDMLRPEDFTYIEEYIACMEPVAVTLDKLQGEKNFYYGYLTPSLITLINKLKKVNNKLMYTQPLLDGLIASVQSRFKDFFNLDGCGENAALAAAMHPAFKLRWLKCLAPDAKTKFNKILNDAVQKLVSNQIPDQPSNIDDDFDFDGNVFNILQNNKNEAVDLIGDELNNSSSTNIIWQYLHQSCTNTVSDINNQPELVKTMFLIYNTPLPSSAPVERLFSYATLINLPRYNRLTDKHFEIRVLCKANTALRHV